MKILIEIENGAVASVTTTGEAEIVIVDHDTCETLERPYTLAPDAVCSEEEFEKFVSEALAEANQ